MGPMNCGLSIFCATRTQNPKYVAKNFKNSVSSNGVVAKSVFFSELWIFSGISKSQKFFSRDILGRHSKCFSFWSPESSISEVAYTAYGGLPITNSNKKHRLDYSHPFTIIMSDNEEVDLPLVENESVNAPQGNRAKRNFRWDKTCCLYFLRATFANRAYIETNENYEVKWDFPSKVFK